MRLIIQPNYQQLSCWAASYVAKKINEFKPTAERPMITKEEVDHNIKGLTEQAEKIFDQRHLSCRYRGAERNCCCSGKSRSGNRINSPIY